MMKTMKKNVDFDDIRKTNERLISITYDCFKFYDSVRFLPDKYGDFHQVLHYKTFKISQKINKFPSPIKRLLTNEVRVSLRMF